jgi:WASH complex subunit strumpellin
VRTIELDEGFREQYMEIIERFFNLFESIYNYYKDFKTFVSNVDEGYFIDYNFEALLQNQEAKRLLIESVHMYGVMLLLLDRLVPALARERLVVCYLRYKGQNSSDYVNEVCKLVRGTGYSYNPKTKVEVLPKNYPLDYFSRYPINIVQVEYLINAVKDDDVYNQLPAYPNAEHRSVALAQ